MIRSEVMRSLLRRQKKSCDNSVKSGRASITGAVPRSRNESADSILIDRPSGQGLHGVDSRGFQIKADDLAISWWSDSGKFRLRSERATIVRRRGSAWSDGSNSRSKVPGGLRGPHASRVRAERCSRPTSLDVPQLVGLEMVEGVLGLARAATGGRELPQELDEGGARRPRSLRSSSGPEGRG